MEYYLFPVVYLCLATNGSSSADLPAGHCLSYSTGAILAVAESQCHSYATSSILVCYKTVFVHPPLFNAATSNHSESSASRSWIRIITKEEYATCRWLWFYCTTSGVGNVNKLGGEGENGR